MHLSKTTPFTKTGFTIALMLFSFISYSQSISAIVNYEGTIKQTFVDSFVGVFMERKDVPLKNKQRLSNDFNSTNKDYYTLHIKGQEATYEYIEPLNTEEGYNMGSRAGRSTYYVNLEVNDVIEMGPYTGNIRQESLNWRITKETKKIGNYTCYKAVGSERLYSRQVFYYNKQVIAWFTPMIPLNFGPRNYVGLPGLVLEAERDAFILRATKIDLNSDEKIKIRKPKAKAKILTLEEWSGIVDERQAALKKTYKN